MPDLSYPIKLDDNYTCQGTDARGVALAFSDLLTEGDKVGPNHPDDDCEGEPLYVSGVVVRHDAEGRCAWDEWENLEQDEIRNVAEAAVRAYLAASAPSPSSSGWTPTSDGPEPIEYEAARDGSPK